MVKSDLIRLRLFVAGYRFSADVPLVASDRIELVKENEKHTIVIKKVVKAEEGIINVKATNDAGQMSASARLKVTGIPSILNFLLFLLVLTVGPTTGNGLTL